MEPTQAATALMLGLAGAGHCAGMCGGIAAALNLAGRTTASVTLAYHGGRIASYTLLGALAGLAAGAVDSAAWAAGLRYVAGALLVGMGLYIADWWRGMALLERAGETLWAPVKALSSGLLPPRSWGQGIALGLTWGLLPCGLIYSSLAWAATAADPAASALRMLLFGVGTLPAMLAVSLGAARLQDILRRRGLRATIGALLVLAGLWTAYAAFDHSRHAHHARQTPAGIQAPG